MDFSKLIKILVFKNAHNKLIIRPQFVLIGSMYVVFFLFKFKKLIRIEIDTKIVIIKTIV